MTSAAQDVSLHILPPERAGSGDGRAGKGPMEIIRHFTPNWFTVTMGTGALAAALHQLPIDAPALTKLATTLWLIDIGLFVLFSLLYAARWVLFFDEAKRIFHHPVMSMFFGAVPMGLAMIVNGFTAFGPALIGDDAYAVALILWRIAVALAVLCGVAVPYLMFTRQEHSMEKLTALWLLPIVACGVVAGSGGFLTPHLPPEQGFVTLTLGYVLWAASALPALSILVLLFLRLALHKLPERDMGATAWLALGPVATASLGLMVLGGAAPAVFATRGMALAGDAAYGVGVVGGLMLWGYGAWWFSLATLKTIRYLREGLPFNLSWWGFTFPLATYTMATLALARVTGIGFFTVAGGVMAFFLTIAWAVVAARTVHGAVATTLFTAPCLADDPCVSTPCVSTPCVSTPCVSTPCAAGSHPNAPYVDALCTGAPCAGVPCAGEI